MCPDYLRFRLLGCYVAVFLIICPHIQWLVPVGRPVAQLCLQEQANFFCRR